MPLSYGLHRPGREIRRSVTVLPRIPELDYAAMFKAADSFVSASHGEGCVSFYSFSFSFSYLAFY